MNNAVTTVLLFFLASSIFYGCSERNEREVWVGSLTSETIEYFEIGENEVTFYLFTTSRCDTSLRNIETMPVLNKTQVSISFGKETRQIEMEFKGDQAYLNAGIPKPNSTIKFRKTSNYKAIDLWGKPQKKSLNEYLSNAIIHQEKCLDSLELVVKLDDSSKVHFEYIKDVKEYIVTNNLNATYSNTLCWNQIKDLDKQCSLSPFSYASSILNSKILNCVAIYKEHLRQRLSTEATLLNENAFDNYDNCVNHNQPCYVSNGEVLVMLNNMLLIIYATTNNAYGSN